MKISKKLPLAAAVLTIITVSVSSMASYIVSADALKTKSDEKLQAIADGRRNQLEVFLQTIETDLNVISSDAQTYESLSSLNFGWQFMQADDKKAELQKRFISDNPNPEGEKHKFDGGENDGYDVSHKKAHPFYREFVEKNGYYDLFIVNKDGDVVYSVFKNTDYATNLKTGEWKDTGLAKVFNKVVEAQSPTAIQFDDYNLYEPSRGAPAAFLGKSIAKNDQILGTMILQMPNDIIAEIMSNTTGLGEKGETLLLKADGTFITDSKKSSEDEAIKYKFDLPENMKGTNWVGEPIGWIPDYHGELHEIAAARIDFQDSGWIVSAAVPNSQITEGTTTLRNIIAVIALGLLGLALAAAFLFSRTITKPIGDVIDDMNELKDGNTDLDLYGAERNDEIGDMFKAVAVFRDAALEKERLEEEGEENRAMTEEERKRNEAAKAEDARKLSDAVEALGKGLQQLAEGDLGATITEPFAGDLDRLRTDFNASLGKLSETMTNMNNLSVELSGNSTEISNATKELCSRTETQAASLEETSAALDEITATVKQTAERADEAATSARAARSDTEQSSHVVSNAVSAMEGIEKASNDISNIINVIDEIAFQTNLLALNAGVEAARAGEAGKGFAVVAQEVRELAQRSAGAAKEIKDLINKSGDEVSNGVELVKQTGEALATISEHVTKIDNQIETISQGAGEQLIGIQEVNSAVNSMDQMTQQNAAMVEENTAVTQQIADEVHTLSSLIQTFKVSGTTQASKSTVGHARVSANVSSAPIAPTSVKPVAPASKSEPKVTTPKDAQPAVKAVTEAQTPKPSPAKNMLNKVASAFGGETNASDGADDDNWDEF